MMYGGEEKFTVSLGNWLATHDHDVTVMGSTFASVKTKRLSKTTIEKETDKEIKALEQKKIKRLYPPYFVYFFSRLVMSLVWIMSILLVNLKYPISLIHAQDTGYAGLAGVIAGKILRIPVLISSHGIRHKTIESSIRGRFNKKLFLNIEYRLDLFTIKNAGSITAVNPSIKRYFEQLVPKKIDFIPIPIKLENFEFSQLNRELIRKDLGIDKVSKVIGFVGRFSPEKNLLTLLNSFVEIAQTDPSTKLVLVGTGPDESHLKEYVVRAGIKDQVIFCGVRYDIGKILSSFDIFVLPSYIEGLSTSLLEAMTSGRAIICSDIPANNELVMQNQEALLINPYDSGELKQAIQLLIKNASIRLKLGHNAKHKVRQYDENLIFPKILEYYDFLLKE